MIVDVIHTFITATATIALALVLFSATAFVFFNSIPEHTLVAVSAFGRRMGFRIKLGSLLIADAVVVPVVLVMDFCRSSWRYGIADAIADFVRDAKDVSREARDAFRALVIGGPLQE